MEPDEVFPELVWKKIFEKIEDDKDKLSFLRAHSAFRKQFKEKHVELGFLFTLPVLMNYFEAKTPEVTSKVIQKRRQSILSCRLVSRKCSQAVDNWMQSHWEKEIHPPHILCKKNKSNATELWSRPQVEKFTKHFGNLQDGRMPIVSRSLRVGIPLHEVGRWNPNIEHQELEDNERRNEILTLIGGHVKALTVDITLSHDPGFDNVENMRDRIETFKSVLEQVPNLRSLNAAWQPICYPDWEDDEGVLDFPELPQLVHLGLQINEDDEAEEDVFLTDLAPFERYFPQLTHLDLWGLDVWKDEYLEAGKFPKLRHLHLINVIPEKDNHKRKLKRMCRKLFAPNLETFCVYIINGSEMKAELLIRKLLKLLNKACKKEDFHWHGSQENGSRLHFWRV